MSIRVAAALLGLGLVAALAIGCGGNGGSEEAGPIPKKQFTKRAGRICRAGLANKEQSLAAASKAMGGLDSSERGTAAALNDLVLEGALPPLKKMVDELAALPRPTGEEELAEEILGKFEDGLEEAESNPKSFVEGNPFTAADQAAQAYGLIHCVV
jgi:hypothetical protein